MFSSFRKFLRSSGKSARTETDLDAPATKMTTRGHSSVGVPSPWAIRETSLERPLPQLSTLDGQGGSSSMVMSQQLGWTNRPPSFEWVSQEQFQNVLENFRVAHAQVELQRDQMEEQERQIILLNEKIAQLEGDFSGRVDRSNRSSYKGVSSTDDSAIKNSASSLAALINRYASTLVVRYPDHLPAFWEAVTKDSLGNQGYQSDAASLRVQSLLRHVISIVVCSGAVNRLLVTDSSEANEQLWRIHERIFSRDPIVAGVWRRQTFSASVKEFSQVLMTQTLERYVGMPTLLPVLQSLDESHIKTSINPSANLEPTERSIPKPLVDILQLAWKFSRSLHESKQTFSSSGVGLYMAFVPDLGSALDATQMELVKRCRRSENQEEEVLGACLFPGLIKMGRDPRGRNVQIVIRRAQVICDCALLPQRQRPVFMVNRSSPIPLSIDTSASRLRPRPEIIEEEFRLGEVVVEREYEAGR